MPLLSVIVSHIPFSFCRDGIRNGRRGKIAPIFAAASPEDEAIIDQLFKKKIAVQNQNVISTTQPPKDDTDEEVKSVVEKLFVPTKDQPIFPSPPRTTTTVTPTFLSPTTQTTESNIKPSEEQIRSFLARIEEPTTARIEYPRMILPSSKRQPKDLDASG